MMRTAYVLSFDKTSERTKFSCNLLSSIGFDVKIIDTIPHNNAVISNKLGMQYIYGLIENGSDDWVYVFEDDINVVEKIELSEIIQYETISNMCFYLGCCKSKGNRGLKKTSQTINDKVVYSVSGYVAGLHAIALSKKASSELLSFSENTNQRYMDKVLGKFTKKYPANVVRYDLESYIRGHRGIFFQDRRRFKSDIK